MEVDQSLLCESAKDVERRLFNRAINCLARREHSRKELHDKLVVYFDKWLNDSDVVIDIEVLIESTLARVSSYGYLDDRRFAEMFVRSRTAKGFGPVRIKSELERKGVASDIIAGSLTQERSEQIEILVSGISIKKKWSNINDYKVRAQISRHYAAKGFSFETIRAAIETVSRTI
ncbi:MAG: regulatory protein RecX [Hahellaceae bacterium]|nr:regulatory protein RecX [Hahellaceae bacterium]MCP5212830.1 regulatory protein RecX [Hahellaceae bacterium]